MRNLQQEIDGLCQQNDALVQQKKEVHLHDEGILFISKQSLLIILLYYKII